MTDRPVPDRSLLTVTFCRDIVIDSTGRRSVFVHQFASKTSTFLSQLGVVAAFTGTYKANIKANLEAKGFTITLSVIVADPNTSVEDCTVSLVRYAEVNHAL